MVNSWYKIAVSIPRKETDSSTLLGKVHRHMDEDNLVREWKGDPKKLGQQYHFSNETVRIEPCFHDEAGGTCPVLVCVPLR